MKEGTIWRNRLRACDRRRARRDLIDEVVQALIAAGSMPSVMDYAADPLGLVDEILGTDDVLTAGAAKRAALIARERGASTEAAERLASVMSPGVMVPRSAKADGDGYRRWETDERRIGSSRRVRVKPNSL